MNVPPVGITLGNLPITAAVRDLILSRAPTNKIEAKAIQEGMVTLRRDGMVKVKKSGMTSLDEVIKETVSEE